ncbi:MAG: hypothetical protein WKG06_08300 [Segetibacter sp.]
MHYIKALLKRSFTLLGVQDAVNSADAYIAQAGNENVNYAILYE